jgi:tRNA(Leu) C34 or U34 (ribose-2'-O)-methylase TrmL
MAETVLQHRTSRFSLVLENLYDDYNQQAVIRTADCFGIQNIHVVAPKDVKVSKNFVSRTITKKVLPYMSLHPHESTQSCIEALRASGHEIWATDLSPGAVKLDSPDLTIPKKLAVVFGRELTGCSKEILETADKRVFIPIYGFAESLNLSVAASLVMQTLFTKCPDARGDMSLADKAILREKWYNTLGRHSEAKRNLFKTFLVNPPPPLDDIRRADKESFFTKKRKKRPLSEAATTLSSSSSSQASPSSSQPHSPGGGGGGGSPKAKRPKFAEPSHAPL